MAGYVRLRYYASRRQNAEGGRSNGLYFGYLAAIKEQNGAAMSLGRVSTFFDIYIERDIKNRGDSTRSSGLRRSWTISSSNCA